MLSSRPVALGTDSQFHTAKTPGRVKGRVENALQGGTTGTVLKKGKEIAQRTPFHPATQRTHVSWTLHSQTFLIQIDA